MITRIPIGSRGASMHSQQWLPAKAAAELLGVKLQTLYAYVSRETLRTTRAPGGKESFYLREDVERVVSQRRRGAAEQARGERFLRLGGGGTVLQTAICTFGPAGPSYRGRPAADLIRAQRSFEDCVELLWTGVLPDRPVVWAPLKLSAVERPLLKRVAPIAPRASSRALMALLIDISAACAESEASQRHALPAEIARRMIQVMTMVFGLLRTPPALPTPTAGPHSLAQMIEQAAQLELDPSEIHALNASLIISAEHELAPATFVTRVAASAEADVYSCIAGGLAAFDGTLRTGVEEAEVALRAARSPAAYAESLRQRKLRTEPISGYGHALYPAGDPRARLLIELADNIAGRKPATRRALDAISAATDAIEIEPSIGAGLSAIAIALQLPPGSGAALMALGRSAGWIAHAFEQRLTGVPLRPRARYVGAPTGPEAVPQTF